MNTNQYKMSRAPAEVSSDMEWFDGEQINEILFCKAFLTETPLRCINGNFFGLDGLKSDSEVEKEIYEKLKNVLSKNVSKKVKQLMDVLRMEAYAEEMQVQMDRIHVKNGTYFLDGTFKAEKEFCINRLPVEYKIETPEPVNRLNFVSGLL